MSTRSNPDDMVGDLSGLLGDRDNNAWLICCSLDRVFNRTWLSMATPHHDLAFLDEGFEAVFHLSRSA